MNDGEEDLRILEGCRESTRGPRNDERNGALLIKYFNSRLENPRYRFCVHLSWI